MTEQLLNLVWLAVATTSLLLVLPRRRNWKSVAGLLFALALLFPIISATDDLLSSDRAIDGPPMAVLLTLIAFGIGLTVVGRLVSRERAATSFVRVLQGDPRSPPRR